MVQIFHWRMKICLFFFFFGIVLSQTVEYCQSANEGNFFNSCYKVENNNLFYLIAKNISKWFSPKVHSIITEFFFIFLPFLMLYGCDPKKFNEILKEFGSFKIETLHFLHRIGKFWN